MKIVGKTEVMDRPGFEPGISRTPSGHPSARLPAPWKVLVGVFKFLEGCDEFCEEVEEYGAYYHAAASVFVYAGEVEQRPHEC